MSSLFLTQLNTDLTNKKKERDAQYGILTKIVGNDSLTLCKKGIEQLKLNQLDYEMKDIQYKIDLNKWQTRVDNLNKWNEQGRDLNYMYTVDSNLRNYIEYNGDKYDCTKNTFQGCCNEASGEHQKCKKLGKFSSCSSCYGCIKYKSLYLVTATCADDNIPGNALLNVSLRQGSFDSQLKALNNSKPQPPNYNNSSTIVCQDCRNIVENINVVPGTSTDKSKSTINLAVNQMNQCIANVTAQKEAEVKAAAAKTAEEKALAEKKATDAAAEVAKSNVPPAIEKDTSVKNTTDIVKQNQIYMYIGVSVAILIVLILIIVLISYFNK